MSAELILGVIGIIVIVLKIVDYLVQKRNDNELLQKLDKIADKIVKSNDDIVKQIIESHEKIASQMIDSYKSIERKLDSIKASTDGTWRLLDNYDDDGKPMCYVPRSWLGTQEKLTETMGQMLIALQSVNSTLSRIENKN